MEQTVPEISTIFKPRYILRLGMEWAGRLRHVQFGRVRGMSTRRGNVVFLSDILDEAFERMREKQGSDSIG